MRTVNIITKNLEKYGVPEYCSNYLPPGLIITRIKREVYTITHIESGRHLGFTFQTLSEAKKWAESNQSALLMFDFTQSYEILIKDEILHSFIDTQKQALIEIHYAQSQGSAI